MGFFSNNHVLQAGLQGSAGPEVGFWDTVVQGYQQQYHVDSALALHSELGLRWEDSLAALREHGQNFETPSESETYIRYASQLRGQPWEDRRYTIPGNGYRPEQVLTGRAQFDAQFEEMQRANAAIRQLNDPNIRTFEQILDATIGMQQEVEGRTASMAERAGTLGTVGGFIGAMGGSFTTRDPINLITAPIGFGRTVATRIAVDMAVAGLTTAATEFTYVEPNRALAGLPERNPYYDIAASALGAGVIRGAVFEPLGHVASRLRSVGEDINFDFRDAQMQQMFAAAEHSPSARAASSILDDAIVFETANPYGEGHVAGYRWQAELEATARALNGEPEVPLELPPIPSDQIERSLSFQTVKETAPELWDELESARTRLNGLDDTIAEVSARDLTVPDAVRLVDPEAATRLDQLTEVMNDESLPEPVRTAADMEAQALVHQVGQDKIMKAVDAADTKAKFEVQNLRASRKAANKAYRAAYQKVEQEAVRLEHAEAASRSIAQAQAIDVLAPTVTSEPITGPLTRFDFVEAHAGKVDVADAAIPAKADSVNDLAIDPKTGTVDIGTRTPVSADFKVPFDDGELSVKEILDDLAEDQRLEEAVKGCAI